MPSSRRLTVHNVRHTFITHALAVGQTLAQVRVAMGYANLVTTSLYRQVTVEDAGAKELV